MSTVKRKSYLPDHARFNFIRDTKANFRHIIRNAKRFAWSQSFILDARNKQMTGKWLRLSGIDQAELMGYFDALCDELVDNLEFRYQINGKWYTPSEVINGKDGTCTSRDVGSGCSNGHYVYTINTENGPEYRIY